MKTNVKLREQQKTIEVAIAKNSPSLPEEIIEQWQKKIDLITRLTNVRAGLIMKITPSVMQVYLKSQNDDNPYSVGGSDSLCHGLYCETVIGEDQELYVQSALEHQAWKDNPDVKLNMISYFGLPIKYPDGRFFGTICLLDDKSMDLSADIQENIRIFCDAMEKDLLVLSLN